MAKMKVNWRVSRRFEEDIWPIWPWPEGICEWKDRLYVFGVIPSTLGAIEVRSKIDGSLINNETIFRSSKKRHHYRW